MAAQSFLTNLQLNGNQLLKSVFENVATDPAADLVAGRIIYNTTSKTLKFYDGTAWVELGDSSAIAKAMVKNTDGSITIGTPSVANGTPISVALSDDEDQDITLESDGLKVKKYSGSASIDINSSTKEISISSDYTNSILGNASTDTKDSTTIVGAKKYADNVKTEVQGNASTDTKDSATVAGAKKYADNVKSEVIGNASTDTSASDTINGAKKYADAKKSEVIGTSSDPASADTINGAKAYADAAIEALDVATQSESGKYVKTITEQDGKVSVTFGQVAAAEVSVADPNEYFTGTDVEAVLAELYEQAGTGSAITITEVTSGLATDVLKAYKIYQGDPSSELNLKGTINIPKDLVVTSGSVVRGTWSGDTFTEDPSGDDKALKLVIANQTDPVYINVVDLVKDHTAGNGIAISSTNEISLVLDPTTESFLTLSASGLKLSGVQSAINTAKSDVIGTSGDAKTANTIYGAKAYSDSNKSDVIGTSGDAASANTINGAKAYSDANKSSVIGQSTDAKTADTINGAKAYADDAVATLSANLPHYYTHTYAISGTNSQVIAANEHNCGLMPMVQTFVGTEQVICQVSIAATGAITISWNGTITSLTVVVVGLPASA